MKISFCTTCGNRLHQLQQTFEQNLAVISRTPGVEWVIVNFNSRDALHEFMLDRLPGLPANVVYARDPAERPWHMAIAKNIAHRAASGDLLVNLDCDNFIGAAADVLRDALARSVQAVHLWSGVSGDGTCGRIAVARDVFHALGGYDESFHPVGHEDLDLLKRIRARGIAVEDHPCPAGSAIMNSKEEGMQHCSAPGLTWIESRDRNKAQSNLNIAEGRIVANLGKAWGRADLEWFRLPRT